MKNSNLENGETIGPPFSHCTAEPVGLAYSRNNSDHCGASILNEQNGGVLNSSVKAKLGAETMLSNP